MSTNRKIAIVPEVIDTGAVVCCGNRGITIYFDDEPENYRYHLIELTKAVAAMHRAIHFARAKDPMNKLVEEDMDDALGGVELVSNMAAKIATLLPE